MMKKIRMCFPNEKTFQEGFEEYFLLSTGVRQNSLINIKIRDVDFDNSVVYVNTTKNRKPLIIPLNEDIIKILKEYLQYRGGGIDDWLFCSVYGKQLTRSNAIFHSVSKFACFVPFSIIVRWVRAIPAKPLNTSWEIPFSLRRSLIAFPTAKLSNCTQSPLSPLTV